MQSGPDLVGGVGPPTSLIARHQHSPRGNPDYTGQADPFPDAAHAQHPRVLSVDEHTVTVQRALAETRTGDIWLFRGRSGPDRAIQTLSNAPVNHVGMTVAIDDLPPLIWHAELGDKLLDLWTGTHHRGVQLNDARAAVEQWMGRYQQRCWFRQLDGSLTRQQEDRLLAVIARMDGTAFPTTARLTARWLRGRLPTLSDWTRGIPLLDSKMREVSRRRKARRSRVALHTAYCAETVAVTYDDMGLLSTDKNAHWFDPGSFWSGDGLPLTRGYRLGQEIAVVAD